MPGTLPFSGTKDKAGYMKVVGAIRSGLVQDGRFVAVKEYMDTLHLHNLILHNLIT